MPLNLEIQYKNTQIQQYVVRAELAERTHARMVAAGIFMDAESSNRVLNHAAAIIDAAVLNMGKTLTEAVPIIDAVALAVSTVATDAATTSDNADVTVQFVRNFTDAMTVDDVISVAQIYSQTNNNVTFIGDVSDLAFTHPVSEAVALSDVYNFDIAQVKTDAANASDVTFINHYLGEGQIFNRPLFNQSTFG